ncbi:MAG TPA: hypothetical protein VJ741_17900 [Solirubrobacteraceae bacterium]|nr:hypothetical protein [Solirubrobacteraceae bacterium]
MEIPGVEPHISDFVLKLIGTGIWLSELASDLVEALPDDAYPGEEPGAVILEMLCGTAATALRSEDPGEVERATELIELARDRTVEHLQLTLEMSRRRHCGNRRRRRGHG